MDIFIKKNRVLLKEFVKTDFKLRYQQNVIGYLWSIINPLMHFAVMYTVYVKFLKIGANRPHWGVAMLLGIVIWTFFSEATNRSMHTIVKNGGILRKANFSKTLLVLSEILGAGINFLINLVVLSIFLIVNGIFPTVAIVATIPLMIELFLITTGISFFLATWYVNFRDIGPIWQILTQLLMYAMPLTYPLSLLQEQSALVARISLLNPLSQTITDFRRAVMGSQGGTYPGVFEVINNHVIALIPYILSILVFVLGYLLYRAKSPDFAENV